MFRSKHIVGMDASIDIPETTTHQQTGQQFEHVSLDFLPSFRAFRSCVDRKWTKKSRDLQHLQILCPQRTIDLRAMVGHRSWENLCFSRFASSNFLQAFGRVKWYGTLDWATWNDANSDGMVVLCVFVKLGCCSALPCNSSYIHIDIQVTYTTVCTSLYKCIYIHLDSQSYMNNILCVTRAWRVEQIFGSLLNSYCIDIFWRIDTYFTCKQRQYF